MASQKLVLVLFSVLVILTVTHGASVHKRSASGSNYGYDNDLIEDTKQDRELEMKHDLKRLLEILLLDELERNEAAGNSLNYDGTMDWIAQQKRGAPRPGK